SASYRPPRTPQEEILASLFAEVLGVERVGIDDNFFDMGGHSLLALQLQHKLKRSMGIDVALRKVFEFPTVSMLSEQMDVTEFEHGVIHA
ncbi:phosphopantetheine-binding protein, partial [Rhizobium paknamense]|uniref:phosphopantetheine-binding protein n=1 Tax=Rhizobium paknamense TaxID=1206817 RepID=UPI0035E5FB86